MSADPNDPQVLRAVLAEEIDKRRDLEVCLAHAEEERELTGREKDALARRCDELVAKWVDAERRVERLEEERREIQRRWTAWIDSRPRSWEKGPDDPYEDALDDAIMHLRALAGDEEK